MSDTPMNVNAAAMLVADSAQLRAQLANHEKAAEQSTLEYGKLLERCQGLKAQLAEYKAMEQRVLDFGKKLDFKCGETINVDKVIYQVEAQLAEHEDVISTLARANQDLSDVLMTKLREEQAKVNEICEELAEAQAQLAAERLAADSLAAMVRQLCLYKNDIEGLKRKAIDLTCRLGRGGGFARSELDELAATRQPTQDKGE